MDKTITARELNVQGIFADEALVRAIRAANIDVDDLFANTAFIAKLRTVDITGNEALRLYVEGEVSAAKDEALDAVGDAVAQITLTADAMHGSPPSLREPPSSTSPPPRMAGMPLWSVRRWAGFPGSIPRFFDGRD